MSSENSKQLSKDVDATRDLESSRFSIRGRQEAAETSGPVIFSWVEDAVISKRASVVIGKDVLGKETATVKMVNPETNLIEDIYYTTEKEEVARFKSILEGKPLVSEVIE